MHVVLIALLLAVLPNTLCDQLGDSKPPKVTIVNATVLENGTSYVKWSPFGSQFNTTEMHLKVVSNNIESSQGVFLCA